MKIGTILKQLNNEMAAALSYDKNDIWSYWQFIERHMYAVGDSTAAVIEPSTHSPIIEITGFEGKSKEQIETMLNVTADVISNGLGIERSNIFITFSEVKSGCIFDGGQIVYSK
jgi:hypothetical protein